MKSKQQKKSRKLTRDEFLSFIPQRSQYEWRVDNEGIVHIQVPKFQGKWGKRFCRLLRRKETFTADMDKLGSIVWNQCDGKHTVYDILTVLEEEYGDEKDLDQRLFLFLEQMKRLHYIWY